ncbi:MAG: hypothetical protein O3B84_01575, partial [Chloroflexi bacterium]|nr:hypothetical protein [Chloroflexota bacterium]
MSTYLKTIGQVIAAAVTAILLVLDFRDITPPNGVAWQWWALVAFLTFVCFTLWAQFSQLQLNRRLIADRPILSVALADSDEIWRVGGYSLVISNTGSKATVSVQVRIGEGLEHVQRYYQDTFTAVWEGGAPSVDLMNGLQARMLLIEPDIQQGSSPPFF